MKRKILVVAAVAFYSTLQAQNETNNLDEVVITATKKVAKKAVKKVAKKAAKKVAKRK